MQTPGQYPCAQKLLHTFRLLKQCQLIILIKYNIYLLHRYFLIFCHKLLYIRTCEALYGIILFESLPDVIYGMPSVYPYSLYGKTLPEA